MNTLTRLQLEPWDEFCFRLLADLGGEVPGLCAHDYAKTTAILTDMGFDVDSSIAGAKQFGGDCDCTILLYVEGPSRTVGHRNPP